YVSVAAFQKNVANFIGNSVVNQNLYGIRDETGGPRAQAAVAALVAGKFITAGQKPDDSALFTMVAMMDNPTANFTYDANGNGTIDANETFKGGAANYDGSDAQHRAFATQYDILPQADDPLWTFAVNTPVNNKDAKIHGFEFGGQYFFGDTGF